MIDKNGTTLFVDDDVLALFGKEWRKCFIRSFIKNNTNEEFAFVKFEFARNGGFGSCMVYPKKSSQLEKI